LKYEKQMAFKVGVVKDALKHIAGLDSPSIRPIPAEQTYHYRNKGSFAVQKEGGFLRMGFFKQGSHDVVSTEKCEILPDPINGAKEWIRELLIKHHVSVYNERNHHGLFRELVIRHSAQTNQLLIGLVTTPGEFPEEFLTDLTAKDPRAGLNVCGIVQNINSQKTNVILGKNTRVLWGAGELNEKLGELNFRLSLTSFFQVHPEQTIRLFDIIKEWTKNISGRILDAYCGVGAISLWLGKSGLRVVGIEELPQAVDDARASATANGIDSCSFTQGKVEEHIRKFKGQDIETIILDPPRKGCAEKVLQAVAEISPQRVIYVSCNPSTLARDLARLEGYRIDDIAVIDLFPQTQHVETAVLLNLRDA
jgi:23S rRNA (uracil1939-C5)-methyltransferase